MLILQNCRFLCSPKTGSQWASQAIRRSVKQAARVDNGKEEYHCGLKGSPNQELPAIAFVRHPLSWYPSYWGHRQRHGWKPEDVGIDQDCGSDSFQEFMESIVTKHPGWLGDYFSNWVGVGDHQAGFIGRYENLQSDLISGLRQYGEEFDEVVLRETPEANVGDYRKWPAVWTEELRAAVCESEKALITSFYGEQEKSDGKPPHDECTRSGS